MEFPESFQILFAPASYPSAIAGLKENTCYIRY